LNEGWGQDLRIAVVLALVVAPPPYFFEDEDEHDDEEEEKMPVLRSHPQLITPGKSRVARSEKS
jgi:hypothetical protein